MNKKILFIGIGVILIGIFVVGGIIFFHNPEGTISENIRNVLPFGQGGGDISAPADNDKPEEIVPNTNASNLPALLRLSEVPVSGAIGLIKNNSTIIRYTDRATGHIYDINPSTLEKTKVANITLPKIYEAYFKKDGSGVIYRSLKKDSDEIINTSIELIPPKGTSTDNFYTEVSTIMRGDIKSLDVSGPGKLAYYIKDTASIDISSFNGSGPQVIYNSIFKDWNINWAGNTLTLVTKPSAYVVGYSYVLNPASGSLKKLKGPFNALTLLRNPAENRIVYSYNDGSLTRTFYENLLSKDSFEISSTFADKCVWGSKQTFVIYCASPEEGIENNEPDLWYQGRTHYHDNILKINTDSGITNIVLNTKKDFNVDVDVVNPFLTPDEDYLIFMNKNDLSLWALKLVE